MIKAGPTSVELTFRQSTDEGGPVIAYELRSTPAPLDRGHPYAPLDVTSFPRWAAAPAPAAGTPGTLTDVKWLAWNGPRAMTSVCGPRGCAAGLPQLLCASRQSRRVTRDSGCVIVTAAHGSDLEPEVALLRRQRDWLASRPGMARLAALLYGDSAPPLAELTAQSNVARAVVRSLLRPLVAVDVAATGMSDERLAR